MSRTAFHAGRRSPKARARGISLVFALLALVALSLAAVALIRSIDTSTLVMGNLGFKQETTALAEQGTQAAILWLNNQASTDGASLDDAIEGVSLYSATGTNIASPQTALPLISESDRADVDPEAPGEGRCAMEITSTNNEAVATPLCPPGNELFIFRAAADGDDGDTLMGNVRYSITRLCSNTGPFASANCVQPASLSAGSAQDKGSLDYSRPEPLAGSVDGVLYRIVVRAQGARNTTTYTETIVQR